MPKASKPARCELQLLSRNYFLRTISVRTFSKIYKRTVELLSVLFKKKKLEKKFLFQTHFLIHLGECLAEYETQEEPGILRPVAMSPLLSEA